MAGAGSQARRTELTRRAVPPRHRRRAGLPARPGDRRAAAGRARRDGPRGGRARGRDARRRGAPRLDVRGLDAAGRRGRADRRRRRARRRSCCSRADRSGRCWPPAPPRSTRRWPRPARTAPRWPSTASSTGSGCRCTSSTARCTSTPAASTRSPTGCPRSSRRWRRCRRGPWCSTARRSRSPRTAGRGRSRRPAPARPAGSTSPRCAPGCRSRRTSSTCCTSTATTSSTLPGRERFARLSEVLPPELVVPRTVTADPDEARRLFADVVAAGHEGVVVKGLDAPYDAGRRGAAWVKVKPRHTLDLVVLAVEWGSGRRRGWLSNIHLGARDPGDRRLRDARQDLQGHDRRDAHLADRAVPRPGGLPRRRTS